MASSNNIYRIATPSMTLGDLRRLRGMPQKEMGSILGTHRAHDAIAKQGGLQIDVLVSSLEALIEAMGGELVLMANFPDGSFRITSCADADDPY